MGRKLQSKDYVGKVYGRLTVLDIVQKQQGLELRAYFGCRCECGNIKDIPAKNIMDGRTTSCGCYQKEHAAEVATKHNCSQTRIYSVWTNVRTRCHNENSARYKDYGGRGITICDEWDNSFQAFFDWSIANGYEQGLTLERKDNDKGYSPDNCVWTTYAMQNRNKRIMSNNKSGVKGVHFHKTKKKWGAQISINKKQICLGYFDTKEQAALAREKAEIEYWGKDA